MVAPRFVFCRVRIAVVFRSVILDVFGQGDRSRIQEIDSICMLFKFVFLRCFKLLLFDREQQLVQLVLFILIYEVSG